MAYQVCFWAKDGPNGESHLRTVRLTRVAQAESIARHRILGCVRVTLERTDGPPEKRILRNLFIKPGYKDPF